MVASRSLQPAILYKLRRRLHNRWPLVGGLFRQQAARALAKAAGYQALRLLAETLPSIHHEKAGQIARQAIWAASSPAEIEAVCTVWAQGRDPWLGEVIARRAWIVESPPRLRVLSGLQAGQGHLLVAGGAAIARALLAAGEDQDPLLASAARDCLAALSDPGAVDAVCAAWADRRLDWLETALMKVGRVARKPPGVRVLSALKLEQLDLLRAATPEDVASLVQASQDGDQQIATQARQVLGQLADPQAQDVLCQLFIASGNMLVLQAIESGGYQPLEASARAVFLFLTEKWEDYETLDFDHSLLRTRYLAADADLRRRIAEKIRLSGRTDFLTIITGGDYRARIAEFTPPEIELLVQMLIERGAWGQLWPKIFELPLVYSQRIVQALAHTNWQPESTDDRAQWATLQQLAATLRTFTRQQVAQLIPPAILRARVRLVGGRINDVAFAPHAPRLAVGTSQRKVVLWNFQSGERQAVLNGFDHSIAGVRFSQDGTLYIAERTVGEAVCATYVWNGEQLRRIWEFPGSITALETCGVNQALLCGRDSRVVFLDAGSLANVAGNLLLPDYARAACISPNQGRAALLNQDITLVSLPSLEVIAATNQTFLNGTARCAAFAPDGQGLVAGMFNGEILSMADFERPPFRLAQHGGQTSGLVVLNQSALVVSAGTEGIVKFTSIAGEGQLGQVETQGERLTSLHISPEADFMATGDADASLSLWDLRSLRLPELFEIPLLMATPNHVAALSVLKGHQGLSQELSASLAFIEQLLLYRFRFDIEISEVPAIKFGEFDIEIAG